jgi:hypothetical protein
MDGTAGGCLRQSGMGFVVSLVPKAGLGELALYSSQFPFPEFGVIQFSSTLFRCIVFRSLPSLVFLAAMACVSSQCALAQAHDFATEGYITAVNPPNGFDVNGEHVATFSGTAYGLIGDDTSGSDNSLRSALRVGTYVQVVGLKNWQGKFITPLTARQVLIQGGWDNPITGFSVIERVIANGPEPVFQADGYRIRLTSATKIKFSEGLRTLADVGANTWLDYKGKLDTAGVVVASRVEFLPAKPAHFKAIAGWEMPNAQFEPPGASLQGGTSSGNEAPPRDGSDQAAVPTLDGKVKLGPLGGWHKVPANPSLQDRVRNVGMRLVPDYQKRLAADHPSKIDFRFYAIDDAKNRTEICSPDGLILIPTQVVERLMNDDQLAAVLADGVAYNLERMAARIVAARRISAVGGLAGNIAEGLVPGLGLVPLVGGDVAAARELRGIPGQTSRVALSLMADAGYDPWQAPEAWRLLEPKDMPSNPYTLKYPVRSGYLLAILNLQYKAASAATTLNTAPNLPKASAPSQAAAPAQ